jgi:hypothetical protein
LLTPAEDGGRGKERWIMAIELVPLCTMRLQSKPAVEVGTGPAGTRLIVDCIDVKVEGDRLRGKME